jgi:hypothetical protein
MAIRSTTTLKSTPIDDLIGYLDSFNEIAQEEFDAVFAPIADSALAELRSTPPPRGSEMFIWSTNAEANRRAQRWYFAAVARGDVDTSGGHYIRSGKMAEGWIFTQSSSTGGIAVVVENDSPGSRWVYGSLAQDGAKYQNPGHGRTGWQVAKETVDFWTEALIEDYLAAMYERLGDFATISSSTRAYTSKRPKRA